jgi:hypothetical protein
MENNNQHKDPLYSHLKNKLNELKNQAPKELWNRIDIDLEKDNSLIDQKLREHFSENNKKAPESIWYSIEKQLNIDLVWNKLSPKLDKLKLFHVWKNRLKKLSVAALLLLLLRGCGVDMWIYNQSKDTSSNLALNSLNSKFKEPVKSHKDIKFLREDLLDICDESGNNTSEIASVNNYNYSNKLADLELEENSIVNASNEDVSKDEISNFEKNNELRLIQEIGNVNNQYPTVIDIHTIYNSTLELKERLMVNDLPMLNLKNKNPYLKLKFDLGLVSTIQQIFLKNDLNAKILSNYVPSSSSSTIGYAYGLSLGVNFNHRHTFVSEILINSKMRQDYVYQNNGKVNRETVDFDYFKFNMLYKFNLLRFGGTKRNVLNLSSGLYLSHLKNNDTNSPISNLRNNSTLQINVPQLNNWDWGFLANVGMEHSLQKNLIFEYGLRTDVGLGSVYKPSNSYITVNGISNFIGLGFYSTVKYRF